MVGDFAAAAAAMEEAHALVDQITLWTALMVGAAGDLDRARRLFGMARIAEPRSAEHLHLFLAKGHVSEAFAPVIEELER